MTDERLRRAVEELGRVMRALRERCPWDAAQTADGLRTYLLEECHEVLEALDERDAEALKSELGDLIFQVWFHAEIAAENPGGFDLCDVLEALSSKLVRRHPHVFAAEGVAPPDAAAVQRAWEKRKLDEGRTSRLDGVPRALPALARAQAIQRRAATVGFEWPDVGGALAKLREEIDELEVALAGSDPDAREHELGDVLFSVVNVARYAGVDAESALRRTGLRFTRRFRCVEEEAARAGRDLEDMSLDEMDALWELAKAREKDPGEDADGSARPPSG